MAKHKKSSTPSSFEDFKNYLNQRLSEEKQHAFEKKTIEDDFESDALEGFDTFDIRDIENDIKELDQRLSRSRGSATFVLVKIAAAVGLFIAVTISFFFLFKPVNSPEFSQHEISPAEHVQSADSSPESAASNMDRDSLLLSQEYVPTQEPSSTSSSRTILPPPKQETNEEELLALDTELQQNEQKEVGEERMTEDAIQESTNFGLQKIEPIKETELEPIPETGSFNRIASAKVKPTEDVGLIDSENLPRQLSYPEGIQEVPGSSEKENLSITMGGRTYSRTSKAKSAGKTSADTKEESISFSEAKKESPRSNAQPEGGFEAYYDYLYSNIQSFELSNDSLPAVIEAKLTIGNKGQVTEVAFSTEIADELTRKLKEVLMKGPPWLISSKNEKTVDLKLEFKP